MTSSPRPTTPLRQRMIEDMKLRNLSPHTVQAYVDRVAAFAKEKRGQRKGDITNIVKRRMAH